MGIIYKRGNADWIQYYRNGKPYRESTKSSKEVDARRLLKKMEGEIAGGKLLGIYFDRVRFDEPAEGYFRHQRLEGRKDAERTEKRVESRLLPKFSGIRALNITTPLVEGYIEERG